MADEQDVQAKTLIQNDDDDDDNNNNNNNNFSFDVFNGAIMSLLYFDDLLEEDSSFFSKLTLV
jgi:hypothetical protein